MYLGGKVYIDKTLTSFTSGKKVDLDGGSIALTGTTFKATLPEGTVVNITVNSSYINVYLVALQRKFQH